MYSGRSVSNVPATREPSAEIRSRISRIAGSSGNQLVTGAPALVDRFARNFESLWRRLG